MLTAENRLKAYHAIQTGKFDVERRVKIEFTYPALGYTRIAARLGHIDLAHIAFFNMPNGMVENGESQHDSDGSLINYIICDFTVNNVFRNRGVGKRLFTLAVNHPKCPKFLIASPKPNTIPFRDLIKFYGHFGFKPVKEFNPTRWLLKRANSATTYTESSNVSRNNWNF